MNVFTLAVYESHAQKISATEAVEDTLMQTIGNLSKGQDPPRDELKDETWH